jgi:uncharacterized RDD family membrane protein YckC
MAVEEAADARIQETPPECHGHVALPPIAGFWRRFAAFLVDGLVLGLIGQAIALPNPDAWFQIGPYGRLIGLPIVLAYFGLLESRVGNGRTLGGRLLGVAVRDRESEPIGIGRSLCRTLVWVAPGTLNGWALPILQQPILSWLASLVIFGVGGALIFTMLFNRRTRQGLHDMITQTYVVHLTGPPVEAYPGPSRLQWAAAAIIEGVVVVAMMMGSFFAGTGFLSPGELEQMMAVRRDVQAGGRFFAVEVFDRRLQSTSGDTSRILRINGWIKGSPSAAEQQSAMLELAKAALVGMEEIEQFDSMQVSVTSAYDIGIAALAKAAGDTQTVGTWKGRVGLGAAPAEAQSTH